MTNKEIFEAIYKNLDKEYELVCMNYNDEISTKVVEECVDAKDIQPYFESTDEYMWEASSNSAKYYLDDLINDLDLPSEELDAFCSSEEYSELLDEILNRDCSTATKDIFTNASVQCRVTLDSNYESIHDTEDNFEYAGGYLRTMIDLLNLNPQLVKQEGKKQGYEFSGKWPNYKSRNGKEVIRYEDVFRFIHDCWYNSQLTFVGRFDMDALYDALCKGSFDGLTIPKGTTFIAYSSWLGFGGEHEFETINDLNFGEANKRGESKYDCLDVYVDEDSEKHGWTTTSTYGGPVSDDYILLK